MNNSTLGTSGEAAGGESQEDEARMKHLKTLIAVVPIVVNITIVIISTSVFILGHKNAHYNPPQAISSSNVNLTSCSHNSFCSHHYSPCHYCHCHISFTSPCNFYPHCPSHEVFLGACHLHPRYHHRLHWEPPRRPRRHL